MNIKTRLIPSKKVLKRFREKALNGILRVIHVMRYELKNRTSVRLKRVLSYCSI